MFRKEQTVEAFPYLVMDISINEYQKWVLSLESHDHIWNEVRITLASPVCEWFKSPRCSSRTDDLLLATLAISFVGWNVLSLPTGIIEIIAIQFYNFYVCEESYTIHKILSLVFGP